MKEPEDDILKQLGFEDDELLRKVLSELDNLKPAPSISKEEAWARFEQSIIMKPSVKQKTKLFTLNTAWKVAASILVILSAWIGFSVWNKISYITKNNEVKEVILPDNSIVYLNAASQLTYKRLGWNTNRKVVLTGEALFKVNKGGSFEILTLGKIINVLGTEFNVFSRDNYFEVKCISGKVEVRIPGSEKVVLTKGKAIKKEPKSQPSIFNITNNDVTWIKGEFYYNDADLNVVLEEIGHQYDVHIIKNSIDRHYTGYFNKSGGIIEALNNVCMPMGLTYNISNDTIFIK